MIQREGNFNYDESEHWQMSTSNWDWEDLVFSSLYLYYLLNEKITVGCAPSIVDETVEVLNRVDIMSATNCEFDIFYSIIYLIHITIVW